MSAVLKLQYAEDGLQNASMRSNPVVLWGDLNEKACEKYPFITKVGILKKEGHLGSDLLMSAAAQSLVLTLKSCWIY